MKRLAAFTLSLFVVTAANAAVTSVTLHDAASNGLDGEVAVGDLISGMNGVELPDNGWHPANPASMNGSTDPNGLPTFTDDVGRDGAASGLAGLLNDFPTAGEPTKRVDYALGGPTDIGAIQILSGNDGMDGRVFSTTVISTSIDNGSNYSVLGYFQSDPSGTINSGEIGSTLVRVFDDASPVLAGGVTNVLFEFYGVDNTLGEMRDPFDGVNPFTGADDGLTAPNTSPLIWEVDVIAAIPEPSTAALLAAMAAGVVASRRRG